MATGGAVQILRKSLQDAHKSLEFSSDALKRLTGRDPAVPPWVSRRSNFDFRSSLFHLQPSLRPHSGEEEECQWKNESLVRMEQ